MTITHLFRSPSSFRGPLALGALTAATALAALAGAARAQQGPTVVYGGEALAGSAISVTPWGGGGAQDHSGTAYTTAGHSIQIDTAGLYEGGQIVFATPVALGGAQDAKTRYLQFIYSVAASDKYPQVDLTLPTPTPGAVAPSANPYSNFRRGFYGGHHYSFPPGSFQVAQVGGFGGSPYPNGYPGAPPFGGGYSPFRGRRGFPGYPGQGGAPGQGEAVVTGLPTVPIKMLHFVMEFSDGSEVELMRPATINIGEDINWLRAGIPLSALSPGGAAAGNAPLTRVFLATDTPATLQVGEIRLVTDDTAITADAGKDQTVPVGSEVTLVGVGAGGASALKYDWDFDAVAGGGGGAGFASEADGPVARHTFTKAGDYPVTLRVSDIDGIKSAATATVTVHVTSQGAGVAPGGFPGGYPGAGGGYPGGYPGAGGYPGGYPGAAGGDNDDPRDH